MSGSAPWQMSKKAWALGFCAVGLLVCVSSTDAATVYRQDFESGTRGAEWSGAGLVQSTYQLTNYGFGGWHLRNDTSATSVLRISGMAPHTKLTLKFDLAIWDSVDAHLSDIFQVKVDDRVVISQVFGNYFPASGSAGPGTQITPPTTGDYSNPELGYSPQFRDSARSVFLEIDHTTPEAVISFQYPDSQGGLDESFGVDNVVVLTDAVESRRPTLTIVQNLPAIILQWPVWAADFTLTSTNSLSSNAWAQVDRPVMANGYVLSVTLPAQSGSQFFELRKP